MFHDARDLPLTTDSEAAAGHFNTAVEHLLEYRSDVGDLVKQVLAADPTFVMGNVFRGYAMLLFGNTALEPAARKSVAAAEQRAGDATGRERMHLEALRAWVEGDISGANARFESLLEAHPTDLLALKLVNYNYFWLGDRANLRDTVRRVLPSWEEGLPGYGYLLGMLAFGLEECGEYREGEEAGRRAVALNPHDHWATHAVTHVMEMEGRHQDGVAWLDGLKTHWKGCNNFILHLWWHRALFHLEREEYGKVLELYDEEIRQEPSDFYLDVQNAVSLLWRLELRGVPVGDRWEELAEKSAARLGDLALPFTDLHFLYALLAAGKTGPAHQIAAAMREYADSRSTTYAPVIRSVVLPVAEALIAFSEGAYEAAADRLAPILPELHRTGGSHAQRDVIVQTLIEAALRGGRTALARDLLERRTAERPTIAQGWRDYARALEATGDAAAADSARERAESLL